MNKDSKEKELNKDNKAKDNKLDIYFEKKYADFSLVLEGKDAESVEYIYEDENGKISNLFIKRPINDSDLDKQYFDITTPYGYGGPIIEYLVNDKPETKEELLKNYNKDFEKYCKENNIVSEFIRFHPIIGNVLDFKKIYNIKYLQKTVATKISDEDPFEVEFNKSARKVIRVALKEDLQIEVIESPNDLVDFQEVYYGTMDRNDARKFYYFDKIYFDKMLDSVRDNLIKINIRNKDNVVISSGIYFKYGNKFLHAHLSGTRKEYLKYSPAYLLKYATANWAFENKYKYIHYGGGTTSDPEDSLFLFKKKFTKEGFFDFYIGNKIYNEGIYNKLVEKTGTNNSTYFPKYRDPNIIK